jgi:hypothetical protein
VYPERAESTVTRDAFDALLAEAERASRLAAEVAALRRLCAVLTAALGLTPDAAAGTLATSPLRGLGLVAARGLRVGGHTVDVGF